MVLSQLIEEKSNKIIEVIAAAMPIDAMFVGKLFAMLTASILALLVWISAGALLIQLVKHGGVATLPPPAVGWPAFLALGVIYFGMNYLLLGAAFLTIGAQASTAREVQTMSLAGDLCAGAAVRLCSEDDRRARTRRAHLRRPFFRSRRRWRCSPAPPSDPDYGRTCRHRCGRRCGSRSSYASAPSCSAKRC